MTPGLARFDELCGPLARLLSMAARPQATDDAFFASSCERLRRSYSDMVARSAPPTDATSVGASSVGSSSVGGGVGSIGGGVGGGDGVGATGADNNAARGPWEHTVTRFDGLFRGVDRALEEVDRLDDELTAPVILQ
jgi:hypothetical protein